MSVGPSPATCRDELDVPDRRIDASASKLLRSRVLSRSHANSKLVHARAVRAALLSAPRLGRATDVVQVAPSCVVLRARRYCQPTTGPALRRAPTGAANPLRSSRRPLGNERSRCTLWSTASTVLLASSPTPTPAQALATSMIVRLVVTTRRKLIAQRFILVQNRQGKTRLSKYFVPYEDEEKLRIRGEVHRIIAPRDQKYQSNFVEFRNYKLIYRRCVHTERTG